jgi:hypothetical protein
VVTGIWGRAVEEYGFGVIDCDAPSRGLVPNVSCLG